MFLVSAFAVVADFNSGTTLLDFSAVATRDVAMPLCWELTEGRPLMAAHGPPVSRDAFTDLP